MQQHCPRLVLNISNEFFSDTILEMCMSPTERKGLPLRSDILLPNILSESTIVCMIMFNGDAMTLGERFKGLLGLKSFFCTQTFLRVKVT
jgi:hypothetical protein